MREQVNRLEKIALGFTNAFEAQSTINELLRKEIRRSRWAIIALTIVVIILAVGLVIVGR